MIKRSGIAKVRGRRRVMHASNPQQKPQNLRETKLTIRNPLPIESMEVECMRACMRKLAIWYTPNFKPITTHDELDHILSTLGFIPLPPISTTITATATAWKEYCFTAAGAFLSKSPSPPPRPRLPYPRIDGLHVNTYRAFLDAINFYLHMNNISDLFHIRGMPLQHGHDRSQKWCRMVGDDLVYVYREGTMELPAAYSCCQVNKNAKSSKDQNPVLRIVPWKSIIDRII